MNLWILGFKFINLGENMKTLITLLFPILFILVFNNSSISQTTNISIHYKKTESYRDDNGIVQGETTDHIELFGQDSNDISLRFYSYKEDNGIELPGHQKYSEYKEIVLTGDLISLFKKIIVKHGEWVELEKQNKTSIRKDMYAKTGLSEIKAYRTCASKSSYDSYYRGTIFDIPTSVRSKDSDMSQNIFTVKYDSGMIILNYKIKPNYGKEGRVSIYLGREKMEMLDRYVTSGEFDKACNRIANSNQLWDAFEPIDD